MVWKKFRRRGARGWHKNSATPRKYGVLGRTVTLGGETVLPTLGSLWAGIIIDTLGGCIWMRRFWLSLFGNLCLPALCLNDDENVRRKIVRKINGTLVVSFLYLEERQRWLVHAKQISVHRLYLLIVESGVTEVFMKKMLGGLVLATLGMRSAGATAF